MALIDIEYGSLASSETINKNNKYLDDRITESTDSIMTSISSIYSNIATINARLSDLSEQVSDFVTDFGLKQTNLDDKVENYKTEVQSAINDFAMLPDWSNRISLGSLSNYQVPENGYIFILPRTTGTGSLTINNVSMLFKTRENNYDNSAQLVPFPVKKGDIVTCTCGFINAYFIPTVKCIFDNE